MSGYKSQAVGSAFEAWLEAQHEMALHLGVLSHPMEHNQATAKMIGRLIYTKKGIADYTGFTRQAVAIGVEAKSTREFSKVERSGYLPRSEISPKQAAYLDAVARAGGVALLLVEYRTAGKPNRAYACPWLSAPWKKLRTAESVLEIDVAEWRIQPGTCYLLRFCPPVPGFVRYVDPDVRSAGMGRRYARG